MIPEKISEKETASMEKDESRQLQVEEVVDDKTILATSGTVAAYESTQHQQTKLQAIKENWKSVMWCEYSDLSS